MQTASFVTKQSPEPNSDAFHKLELLKQKKALLEQEKKQMAETAQPPLAVFPRVPSVQEILRQKLEQTEEQIK